MNTDGSANRDQGSVHLIRRFLGPLIICFAALVATGPDMIRGNSCGHDFDFHLASWIDAQAAWRQGIFYPHWAASPNWGAGEPRFVFYPPLTWMLGAAFGAIFPWKGVQLAILCAFFALTGLATRALARQLQFSEGPATLAGCAALFSGYSMFTAYERSAFGELAGGFWIPLLLLLVLRDRKPQAAVFRRALDGSAVLLVLVIAGAWLSNAPLGVMSSYLLAAMALVIAFLRRSWAPMIRAAVSVMIGLGISALYLVPAAVEQRWVQIRQAVDDPGLAIENSFLFAHHADPNLALHDTELLRVSIIAVSMLAISFLALFIAWRRGKLPKERALWIPLALIPVAILFLLLPVSLPVWDFLPKLSFLQFPWRWLVALEAPMGIFFAAAVWPKRQSLRSVTVGVCTFLFLGISVVSLVSFHQFCDADDRVSGMLTAYHNGQGFEGVDEYAPPGSENTLAAAGLPDACLTENATTVLAAAPSDGSTPEWDPGNGHCSATYQWLRRDGEVPLEHRRISAQIPHAGFLIMHLREYAAWKVHLNGQLLAFGAEPVRSRPSIRKDGMLVVPVPAGHVELAIDWGTTRDVAIGRRLSAMSLILLIWLYFAERRRWSNAEMADSSPD